MANIYEHNNATETRTTRGLPIFAAKYKDRAIAVLKNSDYHATITLARTAFQIPTAISDSQIRLSSRFDEFGDFWVELTSDVWNEIVHMLKVVEVSTSPRPLNKVVIPEISRSRQPVNLNGQWNITRGNTSYLSLSAWNKETQNLIPNGSDTQATVHIIGGPVDLSIPISDTYTLLELREQVSQREGRLPNRLTFRHQDVQLEDDTKPLQEYGIIDQSIITIMTSAQVNVTTPKRSKVPMRITLYADVSSLKLLIHARLDIPVHEQILMCAGEELTDGTQLGSYPQVSHNCQIVVDVMPTDAAWDRPPHLLCVEVKPAWATDDDDDDGHLYYVLPTSTVLDLKVLIHDLNLISPSRQRLEFRGQVLDDEQNMNEAQVEPGSTLTMHITSQRT
ncbi:unnamed protein product [Rhizoctonia solani]|uniref:Ubiquitin-like domain-containing protein n=1 Tax=Rhizoctonia solani TaxID=456999 RepID=A0A8H3GQH8_9AGAM|nr:unnamed protein product [Rhizoctonia solani]